MSKLLSHETLRWSSRGPVSPANQLPIYMSIVVPVGPGDESWRLLLSNLANLPAATEVLLVATTLQPADLESILAQCCVRCRVRWLTAEAGRAHQMNAGASVSSGEYLWFVHADSQLDAGAFAALERGLATAPEAIHYFELAFHDDGPMLVCLNTLGARMRSRWLGLPFGDQGLCMSRGTFERLGGFNEEVAYGEDHLLVWRARGAKVPLRRVDAKIVTSARKYRVNGWLQTTVRHGWRTWRQAVPEFCRLLWSRIR